ncbi:MAG: hypothetical protein IK102_04510 [Treponema sp.]|nr:hypothetical protein [Treponema sp.]
MLNNISLSTLLLIFVIIVLVLLLIIQQIAMSRKLKKIRQDAVKRSNAVKGGQLAEQLAPYLPNFPCNPADARFIGKPVDFVAFPGLDQKGTADEVLLIEVKTGASQLSQREKAIKEAVKTGKVRYVEYRIEG